MTNVIPDPGVLAAVDITGDGDVDVVFPDYLRGAEFVLHGRGDGKVGGVPTSFPSRVVLASLAIADLDGDGLPDVIAGDAAAFDHLADLAVGHAGMISILLNGTK